MSDCPDCGRPKLRALVYGGCSGFCLAEAMPEWLGNCRVVTIERLRSQLSAATARASELERERNAAINEMAKPRNRGHGTSQETPDAARLAAALIVYPDLPESVRRELGECPSGMP